MRRRRLDRSSGSGKAGRPSRKKASGLTGALQKEKKQIDKVKRIIARVVKGTASIDELIQYSILLLDVSHKHAVADGIIKEMWEKEAGKDNLKKVAAFCKNGFGRIIEIEGDEGIHKIADAVIKQVGTGQIDELTVIPVLDLIFEVLHAKGKEDYLDEFDNHVRKNLQQINTEDKRRSLFNMIKQVKQDTMNKPEW